MAGDDRLCRTRRINTHDIACSWDLWMRKHAAVVSHSHKPAIEGATRIRESLRIRNFALANSGITWCCTATTNGEESRDTIVDASSVGMPDASNHSNEKADNALIA